MDASALPGRLANAQQLLLASRVVGVGDGVEMLFELGLGHDSGEGLGLHDELAAAFHLAPGGAGAAGGRTNGVLGRSEEAFDAVAGAWDVRMLVGVEQARPVAIGELQQMVDEVTGVSAPSATRCLLLELVQVAAQNPLDLGGGVVRVQDLGHMTNNL